MPRIARELTALEVKRLTRPGHHAVGSVPGLCLYITNASTRSWVLRVGIGEKRRHLGLGSYPAIGLAEAREKARELTKLIRSGIDPVAKRRSHAAETKAEKARQVTFKSAAESYIASHGDTWRNPKHRAQWNTTLTTYAYPLIGELHVSDVSQEHILKILEPIWKIKNETASRLRGRIEAVLDWATVRKFREGENPARWRGHLDKLLPAPAKLQKVEHHRALPVAQMPGFLRDLRQREGLAARALELLILTASRSGEVRGANWNEIDFVNKVWTIPGDRMKAGREHRVPLSEHAVRLLKSLPRIAGTDLVFPSSKRTPLSDMTLAAVMRRMEVNAVPHGFRSTFRDWVGDHTTYPRELAEHALAHTIESKVEAAYRHGDALEKRRGMMQAWASYCDAPTSLDRETARLTPKDEQVERFKQLLKLTRRR